MFDKEHLAQIQTIKHRYEKQLMRKANVVAVGVGLPVREGQPIGEPGIIVSVTHKVTWESLSPDDRIPRDLEGVPVWVQEVGSIEAQ